MTKRSLVLASFLSLALTACGSSEDKINEALAPLGGGGKSAVQGPDLTGEWASNCIAHPLMRDGRRQIQLKVAGDQAEWIIRSYSDANCRSNVGADETLKGKLTYTKALANSEYVAQLNIPIDANASAIRIVKVSLAASVLKTSEFFIFDEDAEKEPLAIELVKKSDTSSPTPSQPPAPVEPVLQSGYYKPAAGSEFCPQSISTMKSGGKVQTIYADLDYPCNRTQLVFYCSGAVCTTQGRSYNYRLEMTSDRTYKLNEVGSSDVSVFTKQ